MCFDYFLLEGGRFRGEEVSVVMVVVRGHWKGWVGGGPNRRPKKKMGEGVHQDGFIRALDVTERKQNSPGLINAGPGSRHSAERSRRAARRQRLYFNTQTPLPNEAQYNNTYLD